MLACVVEFITKKKIKAKKSIGAVFWDTAKAFHKLLHEDLIYKIIRLSIPSKLIHLKQSFLLWRSCFSFHVNNAFIPLRTRLRLRAPDMFFKQNFQRHLHMLMDWKVGVWSMVFNFILQISRKMWVSLKNIVKVVEFSKLLTSKCLKLEI